MFLSKYGVARHIYIPIIKRGVVDFAVSADWTPAAGDVKISKDGGAAANVSNLPTAITMGNTAVWDFSLTATEMQAAQVVVTVADSATKAVEDQSFIIATYGNASAQHAVDLSDSVRAGLTALPNAAAGGNGGLPTGDASAAVKVQAGTGTGQLDFTSGVVKANVTQFGGSAGTFASGRPEVNTTHAAGTAWNSGAIGASTLATDTITAAKIAADAIGASELAADAASEIATAVRTELATELARVDVAISTRLADADYTTPLDAAGVRSAVGLASANLDTQLATIAGYIDTEIAAIVSTLGTPAGASLAADIAAVKSDSGAVKAKTDSLTFTVAGNVDANIQYVNDLQVSGTGAEGDEWGP